MEIEKQKTQVEWYEDVYKRQLGNKESINVSPRINGNDYTVVAMTNDGEIATQSISLENLYGIHFVVFQHRYGVPVSYTHLLPQS